MCGALFSARATKRMGGQLNDSGVQRQPYKLSRTTVTHAHDRGGYPTHTAQRWIHPQVISTLCRNTHQPNTSSLNTLILTLVLDRECVLFTAGSDTTHRDLGSYLAHVPKRCRLYAAAFGGPEDARGKFVAAGGGEGANEVKARGCRTTFFTVEVDLAASTAN